MRKILLSFLTIFFFVGIMVAQTANIYVSAYAGSDYNDGSSWQKAYKSIDAALDQVGQNPGTYYIKVAQGSYVFEEGEKTNQYDLVNGQVITIEGGYATPSTLGTDPVHDPQKYVSAFDNKVEGSPRYSSKFKIAENADTKLTFKDIIIVKAEQGYDANASLVTFNKTNNASLTLDNVTVDEWTTGLGTTGVGFIFVNDANTTNILIKNSLIRRSINKNQDGIQAGGQFLRANNGNIALNIDIQKSTFAGVRGFGTGTGLFRIELNCNTDGGLSSMNIEDSNFFNIKRGLAAGQSASVIHAENLPVLTLKRNIFQGNSSGGGTIHTIDSGILISEDNLYQDNYSPQSAGVFWVEGSYCGQNGIGNEVTFTRDKFFRNSSGNAAGSGYGGAILIANGLTAVSAVDKIVKITDSEFFDNSTGDFDGGAVLANTTRDMEVLNSVFCNNYAGTKHSTASGRGGALFVAGSGKLTIDNSTFISNQSSFHGGAVHTRKDDLEIKGCTLFQDNQALGKGGGLPFGGALSINNSNYTINEVSFINNTSQYRGGAIHITSPSQQGNITNVNFSNNTANANGGAIWVNSALNLTNVTLDSNTSGTSGNGGAIAISSAKLHNYNNVKFKDNVSTGNLALTGRGGAIYTTNLDSGNPDAKIMLTNVQFINNQSKEEGGAIYLSYYGLETDNVVFDNNKSNNGDGGAIYAYSLNGVYTFSLVNGKYISNKAVNGGALNLDINERAIVNILNNDFLDNIATEKGGAIRIDDGAIGDEVDRMNNNKFYHNLILTDPNNSDIEARSDIHLYAIGSSYYTKIAEMKNNALQFPPTSTYYPVRTNINKDGYNLDSPNTNTQADANSIDSNYTEISNVPLCAGKACPTIEPSIPTPIVVSASAEDLDNYTEYYNSSLTEVAVEGANCTVQDTRVAFSARSNKSQDINGEIFPGGVIPEIKIYYDVIEANNLTGVSTTTSAYVDANTPGVTVEVDTQKIPANTEGDDGSARPRDLYKTYWIDVTDQIRPGYTYSYIITRIEETMPNTSPAVVNNYEYDYTDPDNATYKTTIVTAFCDSDGDGIPNYMESPNGVDPKQEDTDGDGVPDYMDQDTPGFVDENGDGIDDNYDTDGDGQPDFLDIDADNDGILDSVESGMDAKDPSAPTSPIDTDGDGVPDYLDLDSDNDGINDVDEGNPAAVDSDGDGMVDGPYGDNGLADSLENGDDSFDATVSDPVDTDGDGQPDYQDVDSDGDGIPDSVDPDPYGNGTVPQSQDPTADADGDGVLDVVKDTDGDGIPDIYDVDQTGGTDSDGNGIDDNAEAVHNPNEPDMDGDGMIDAFDPDQDGDGIIDVVDNNPFIFGEAVICEIDPSTASDSIKPTKVGITTLNRSSNAWLEDPQNKLGAYLVLESTTRGFVIPRYSDQTAIDNGIGSNTAEGVEEGMLVWDNDANCLKMFFDNNGDGTMTWNCISSDSCVNAKP